MNDITPKRDRSTRTRYLEDDGVDTFYDVARNTIADNLKSTCARALRIRVRA